MTLAYGGTKTYTTLDSELMRRIHTDLDKNYRMLKLIKIVVPEWAVRLLVESLNANPHIKTLSFVENRRTNAEDTVYQSVISNTKHVNSMWFDACAIPARVAFAMSTVLQASECNITSLYFFNCEFSFGTSKELGTALGKSTKITIFYMQNDHGSQHARWLPIVNGFKANRDSLEQFELIDIYLTNEEMQIVFDALPSKNQLSVLTMTGNHLHNENDLRPFNEIAFSPFAAALKTLKYDNYLTVDSCVSLASVMLANTTLQKLILGTSATRRAGGLAIIEAVRHHPTLQEFGASSVPCVPLSALTTLLRHNRVLATARVTTNHIQTPEDLEELDKALYTNPSITMLNNNHTWGHSLHMYRLVCRRNQNNNTRKNTSLFDVMRQRDCVKSILL